MLDEQAILERLRAAIRVAGSQQAFARQYGISAQYISDVAHGRRIMGQKILDALGLERVVSYRERSAVRSVRTDAPADDVTRTETEG